MCGVMKSFGSAIIFEQQRFGHHRQKEKRHQTYQRRLEREVYYPRQRRVQHQHQEPHSCSERPANQQLSRNSAARTSRPQQHVGAELYCESQSSGHHHRVVLIDGPEVHPQNYGGDDNEGGRHSGKECDRPLLSPRLPPRRSSSSCFCAAEIWRYMLKTAPAAPTNAAAIVNAPVLPKRLSSHWPT